jgi:hypothetical protein
MVPSLGHHHARRALSRQSLEGKFCELRLYGSEKFVHFTRGASLVL